MRKTIVSAAVAALFVVASPVALAQDAEPSAEVKAAICASASVDAVSFPADGRVADAQDAVETARELAAERLAALAGVETVPGLDEAAEVRARIDAVEEYLRGDLEPGNRARHEKILALRESQLEALEQVASAEDELVRAQSAQKDAVDLEAEVRAFVSDRNYAELRSDLCDAPPTPTTPPPADEFDCDDFPLVDGTTAQAVLDRDSSDPHNLDRDGDGVACELDDADAPAEEVELDNDDVTIVVPQGRIDTGGGPA